MRTIGQVVVAILLLAFASAPASAQNTRCDIPREARDIWRCENGFVVGPENVIIRLPIPETDPEALYNAGIEAAQREDWRVAIAYFTAAQERAHRVPRYMFNLGLAHARAGNEVAAIAWLTDYLIAAPDAANRIAVWAQIRTLEQTAEQEIGVLWQRAREAVDLIPETTIDPYTTTRSRARTFFQSALARAGDLDRLGADGVELSDTNIRGSFMPALNDGDFIATRALLARMPGGASFERGQTDDHERWDLGRRANPFSMGVPMWGHNYGADLGVFQLGADGRSFVDQDVARSRLASLPPQLPSSYLSALVATGRGREALNLLNAAPADLYMREHGEELASATGEAALYVTEVRLARDATSIAEAFSIQAQRCVATNPVSCDEAYADYGWPTARLEAYILVATDGWHAGASHLEVFASGRLGARNWPRSRDVGTFSPNARWRAAKSMARQVMVLFVARRGRPAEALALLAETPTLERMALLRTLTPAWNSVDGFARLRDETAVEAGGEGLPPMTLHDIDFAVYQTRQLGGVAYDTEWWLARIAQERDPVRQVESLSRTAEDLARGLRRIRGSYQRTGQRWGG